MTFLLFSKKVKALANNSKLLLPLCYITTKKQKTPSSIYIFLLSNKFYKKKRKTPLRTRTQEVYTRINKTAHKKKHPLNFFYQMNPTPVIRT
jgi:hypothetical protein